MFQYVADGNRVPWADWSPAIVPVAAAAIVAGSLYRGWPATVGSGGAFLAAAVLVVAPFAVAATVGRLLFPMFGPRLLADPWAVALSFAGAGVWFTPLLLLASRHGSLWLSAGTAFLAVAMALRVRQFDTVIANRDHGRPAHIESSGMFSELTQAQRPGQTATSWCAAIALQVGIVATVCGRHTTAASMVGLACFLVTWANHTESARGGFRLCRPLITGVVLNLVLGFVVTSLLIVSFVRAAGSSGEEPDDRKGGAGDLYSGVILLSEPASTMLVAPRPRTGQPQRQSNAVTLASLPFSGEYWFTYGPRRRPPDSALVQTGSPLSYDFTNVDRHALSMVAQQILGTPIDLSCCGRIDVDITSSDPQHELVAIELILMGPGMQVPQGQSLGAVQLSSKVSAALTKKNLHETLRFDLPARLPIRQVNEIRVIFHLGSPRNHRSANIAIDRFHLIPRGT